MELIESSKIENITTDSIEDNDIEEAIKIGQEMITFCNEKNGIGLAAPQIGIFKKIVVWKTRDGFEIIFNPIYYRAGNKKRTIEMCLSYPKKYYMIERWKRITGVYFVPSSNKKLIRKFKHFNSDLAVLFQHEVDHLNGITLNTRGEFLEKYKDRKIGIAI